MTPSNDTPAAPVGSQERYFKARSTGALWRVREGRPPVWSHRGGPWNSSPIPVTLESLASGDTCFECDAHGTPLAEAPETPAPAAPGEEESAPVRGDELPEVTTLRERVEKLEAALRQYADDRNWRLERKFDPNATNFQGISVALEALKP